MKQKLKKILLFALLSLSIVACADQSNSDFGMPETGMEMDDDWGGVSNTADKLEDAFAEMEEATETPSIEQGSKEGNMGKDGTAYKRKVIYTGTLRMQVESIEETHKNVLTLLDNYGAYVSSDNIDNSYGWQENTMTIRVPREKFYDLLAAVEKEAVFIDSKNVNANDVSEEYYDLKNPHRE